MSKYAKIEWGKSIPKTLDSAGLNDATLLFAANELRRLYNDFVPMLRGGAIGLAGNAKVSVKDGLGVIHYQSPHAHFQYLGKLMVSPTTGSPFAEKGEIKVYANPEQDLNHNTSGHATATALWDKVAYPSIIGKYTRAVQGYIERGG